MFESITAAELERIEPDRYIVEQKKMGVTPVYRAEINCKDLGDFEEVKGAFTKSTEHAAVTGPHEMTFDDNAQSIVYALPVAFGKIMQKTLTGFSSWIREREKHLERMSQVEAEVVQTAEEEDKITPNGNRIAITGSWTVKGRLVTAVERDGSAFYEMKIALLNSQDIERAQAMLDTLKRCGYESRYTQTTVPESPPRFEGDYSMPAGKLHSITFGFSKPEDMSHTDALHRITWVRYLIEGECSRESFEPTVDFSKAALVAA